MKVLRKIIEIDEERCDGCGQCVPSCAEGALQIIEGKARVVSDKFCDGLGACLGECPTGALRLTEREADEFDETAVELHMSQQQADDAEKPLACGCPSTGILTFIPDISPDPSKYCAKDAFRGENRGESALSHWPIQIRLIPAKAPFLKGADLLILADCCAVAYPSLHRDFIEGKIVMMGCPKFDDVHDYIEKFSEIFKSAGIKHITTVRMEVPCCSGLEAIIRKGMERAGVTIPMKIIVIGTRGEVLENRSV